MNRKSKVGLSSASVFCLAVCLVLAFQPHPYTVTVSEDVDHVGTANLVIQHPNDTKTYHIGWLPGVYYNSTSHNLLTDYGSTYLRNLIGFHNVSNTISCIGVGNHSTPAVTDTVISAEETGANLARANGTLSVINGTTFQSQKQWTANAHSYGNTTALYIDTTGSVACAIATIDVFNVISGDTLTATWQWKNPSG